ncbi:recombinase RecT [Paracandidimonas lactea]|uniref:recombinase RecT n=1 Tax=Paracandidimonas lactea TaxID=2895524 RepID=UPI001EFF8708|nr:recombinase RecT [Paracandidimonas lactea]
MAANPTSLAELKQTSKMVARDAGIGSVKKFFESQRGAIAAVLPKHVSADRMLKIALGALRTTPKLMNCSVESLMGAVVHCSQLGLEPNTPLGHAYLIPFENRRKGVTEVQIVLGYKGLIDLARRSGQIVSIAAHEVCANDHFEYSYGLEETLVHKPAMSGRGPVIAFYAVAKLVGGGHAFEVMSADQINEIRDASQNYKFARDKSSTVWGQHYAEMGRKTALRRLVKYLPVSIELAQAAALDEVGSTGRSQALDNVLEGDYITPVEEDEDQAIDPDTGEVTTSSREKAQGEAGKPAPQAEQSDAAPTADEYTDHAKVRHALRVAQDHDTLDVAADLIQDTNPQHHAALQEYYRQRQDELDGVRHVPPEQTKPQPTATAARSRRQAANLE